MPGRTHRAAPGEPVCPVEGCERPAGFATNHVDEGSCRRHEGDRSPTLAAPAESAPPPSERIDVLRLILRSCVRQRFPVEEAWRVAVPVALHGLDSETALRLLRAR